jgi:hypothetical protein
MTSSTEQLAQQFATINDYFSSFWQIRKENQGLDEKHLVNTQGFREQSLELMQDTLRELGSPSEAFKKIAQLNTVIPGAAEGFAAAYGMCCGWHTGQLETYWAGVMDVATNLGVSLVTQYFRRGFWAVPNYAFLYLKEETWSDATLGAMLLNGPTHLKSYSTGTLSNNVPGIYRYFELLKKDPACKDEWKEVEHQFQVLLNNDILPMAFPPARDVRHLVLGDKIVKGAECSAITADLIGYLTDGSFTLEDVKENMAVLEYHDSYLKVGFSTDFATAVFKLDGFDNDVPVDDNGTSTITPLFKAKFELFYETLIKNHPAPDMVLATWIFKKQVGECLDIRDQYEGDPLWLQKQLLRQLETEAGSRRVRSKAVFAKGERNGVFLEALLEPLSQDEVMAVCGHSDMGRELGFRVNGDTRLLEAVEDEKTLASALEYALGI